MEAGFVKRCLLSLPLMFSTACVIEGGGGGDYFYTAESADPCGFVINPRTGKGIRWESDKFPVPFYIHESVPPAARENFISAVEHWNQEWEDHTRSRGITAEPRFSLVGDGALFSGQIKNDGYNMLVFSADPSNFENVKTTQAVTKTFSRKYIKDTDIVVNDQTFKFFYDGDYNSTVLALRDQKSVRSLASSRALSLTEKIKAKVFGLIRLFKRLFTQQPYREIAGLGPARVPSDSVDFPSLMVHELGHVPGLAHKEDRIQTTASRSLANERGRDKKSDYSVMEELLPSGHARRDIGTSDLDSVFCGYFRK